MKKLLALPVVAICSLLALLVAGALADVGTPTSTAASPAPSRTATEDIPPQLIATYRSAAASCPGLSWTVLAAIGKVESDHGRSRAPGVTSGENYAGAGGPMQFLSATWAAYGVDGDRDGDIDRYSPPDAIFGAARYLCANGAGTPARLPTAIFAYNHASWYVRKVLDQAQAYAGPSATADASALLSNPRLAMSLKARADLAAGIVDTRLVAVLAQLLARHTLYVGVFKTGHPMIVTDHGPGSQVSTHYYGRGVDIMTVDGVEVSRANRAARAVVLELQALLVDESSEIGQPWADLVGHGTFTNAVHQDHIHVGLMTSFEIVAELPGKEFTMEVRAFVGELAATTMSRGQRHECLGRQRNRSVDELDLQHSGPQPADNGGLEPQGGPPVPHAGGGRTELTH